MSLSLRGYEWVPSPTNEAFAQRLVSSTGLSPIAAHCLTQRIPEETPDLQAWVSPSLDALHDPFLMHDMTRAIGRLHQAIASKEHVRIITDYDVDGTTSSLILQAALQLHAPHLKVDYHIPHRFDEGYGFSEVAAKKAAEDGVGLIVTADIGVRNHASVTAAHTRGVDVLICDHHLPAGADVPPEAIVLCPPKNGCGYPNPALAACGVSLKLASALLADHPKWPIIQRSLLKLAAIGTVADMVSLATIENRAIVTHGLMALSEGTHQHGLQALLNVTGLTGRPITASDVGWKIGPRINAAGRLDDAMLIIELLRSRDEEKIRRMIERVESLNSARKKLQDGLIEKALHGMDLEDPPPFVLVAGQESEGWHRGVVGIAAGRLRDQLQRPTAVVSIQGDEARGSMRSGPTFNAVAALDKAADLLIQHGGHPQAAGFTLATPDVGTLRQRLIDHAQHHEVITPTSPYDLALSPEKLNKALMDDLEQLEPFGQHNPRPVFLLEGVRVQRVSPLGKEGLRFSIPTDRRGLKALWWKSIGHLSTLQDHPVDLLGSLEYNHWRGQTTLQFMVQDVRLHS